MSSPPVHRPPASYSTAELARRLGVSTPTVQRWVDLGYLKAWKTVGGHRRIDAESAERFLADQGLAAVAAELPPPAHRGAGLSVLIVDDNPDDREVLAALVESALPEASVTAVENGFQALVAIGRSVPDVLLTDIVMPHMNGLEMLRHLCNETPEPPRVMLAVSSRQPEQIAALGGLPDGVALVSKPIDPQTFADRLQAAVRDASLTPGSESA
jgi:excisionase family DNA binding protein